jgi:hypothetical protein
MQELDEEALQRYLQSVGFRHEGGVIRADYEWMIKRSTASVRSLADAVVRQADSAGAKSSRARISAIISFVCSLRYEIPRELADGRIRGGVRMPAESLRRRAADRDSMALLALAMIRSIGLAEGGIVTTHDHALVGLRCNEDTGGQRRMGRVSRELVGTAVQFDAV